MSDNETKVTNCPDSEVLGAWFDGELPKNSPEAKHIRECPLCTRQLQLFELFEKTLKRRFTSVEDNELILRITAGVHKKLEEGEKSIKSHHFMSMAFRIAASVVICASAAVFFLQDNPVADDSGQLTPATSLASKSSGDFPYYTDSQSKLGSLTSSNAIPLHKLVSVDYGNTSSPVFEAAKQMGKLAKSKDKPVAIAPEVKQVWIVKDPAATRKLINEVLNKEEVPQVYRRMAMTGKSLEMSTKLTKMQLIKLVRSCTSAGYDLVSPEAPQPEQNVFKGKADDPVLYNAVFIVNK